MSGDICTDNRFEVIAAYKKMLVERTNLETSPDEMAVIDNVLFRFWQLGWLPPVPHGRLGDLDKLADSFEPSDFWNPDAEDNCFAAVHIVHSAPTIIPAEPSKEKWISADLDTIIDCYSNQVEEVYGQYTDTAGNFHWTGTHSGEHKVKTEENKQ